MLRNMRRKIIGTMVFISVSFVGSRVSKAQADPFNFELGTIVGLVYNLLYPIAILYGVFEIIIAGYGIMKSEGEPRALADAKAHLTDSIIGVLFVMLAAVILKVIMKSFLGQDLAV